MNMTNKKMIFREIKKYLKKNRFQIIKKKNTLKFESLGSLSRTLLSSLIVISIFYVMPVISNFVDERSVISKEFENKSNKSLKDALDGKNQDKLSKLDEEVIAI